MATEQRAQGQCLCGSVVISIPAGDAGISVCHCRMCRRWGGGPAMVVHAGPGLRIEQGGALVSRFASSEWAERAFCAQCGSHLFYRSLADDAHYVAAGLFETLPGATLTMEIFVDAKPDWYAFVEAGERLTEAEFLARMGAAG